MSLPGPRAPAMASTKANRFLTWPSLRRKRRRYSLRHPRSPGPTPCLRPRRRLRICLTVSPTGPPRP
eukprot:14426613-Alexandrium_andersonii.AAC.1